MDDLQWTVQTHWRDTQKLTLVQIQRCIFRAGWGSGDVGGRGAGWGREGQRCGDGVTLRSAAAALWRDGSPVSVWNLEKLTRQETNVFNMINVSHPLYDEDNPRSLHMCIAVWSWRLPCAEDEVAGRWTLLPAPGWGPQRCSAVEGLA